MTALDDLTLLRSFIRIAESGSISAAARTLGVSQPSLSRHLRQLELRAGVSLIRRDTHNMSLTEAGFRLLEDARAMLALADDAQQRLHGERSTLSGNLRLFSTIDIGQFLVTRLVTDFLAQHPGITAQLSYSNLPLRMIEDGYEAGAVVGAIADENLVACLAGEVTRYIVAAPQLIAAQPAVQQFTALAEWPWLRLLGPQFGAPDMVVARRQNGPSESFPIEPVFSIEGATGVREAVLLGLGVAQASEWLVREDLRQGRLVRLCPEWQLPALPVHVVYPSGRGLSARARAFIDFAVTRLHADLAPDNF